MCIWGHKLCCKVLCLSQLFCSLQLAASTHASEHLATTVARVSLSVGSCGAEQGATAQDRSANRHMVLPRVCRRKVLVNVSEVWRTSGSAALTH